jgi:DtxR family manganese transport transcriptional regulator
MPAAPRSAPARKNSPLRPGEALRRTRQAHASELAEDYVEAIADLTLQTGEARLVDLAHAIGVTHVSAHRALARLVRAGLVRRRPYRGIFLTKAGEKLAIGCKERHELVVAFLRSLGVAEATARSDAEGIEHHVSPETLRAFARTIGAASGKRGE